MSPAQTSEDDDCPDGPFETDMENISRVAPLETPSVKSQQGANTAVPIEVSRIREGGISFFQGGLVNEGTITWYAFDVERRLFVAVLGSMGNRSKHIPVAEKLGVNQLLRYTDAAGYKRAEYVTALEATPGQVRQFTCMANKLLATESEQTSRPSPSDTMTRRFSLLHQGKTLDFGGAGKRWHIEGELERFIKQPLQEAILQAL